MHTTEDFVAIRATSINLPCLSDFFFLPQLLHRLYGLKTLCGAYTYAKIAEQAPLTEGKTMVSEKELTSTVRE